MLTSSFDEQTPFDEDICLTGVQLEECLHYLQTFGTHSMLVAFYQRHNMFVKALGLIHSNVTT